MDTKELTKLARSLKLPSSSTIFLGDRIKWTKHGGHAGKSTLEKVEEAARAAGFIDEAKVAGASPDGSYVGGEKVLVKENVSVRMGYSYGVTASGNSFWVSVDVKE